MHGFTGKVLHVNLTTKEINIETPSESFYRLYPGGSLMGLYYLWKNTPAGIEPLAPENTLTFAASAPTGLPVSGQSRATVTCKSPSTGGVADSQGGGFWPAELKFSGFDAIVVQGAADSPVYLWVHDGEAELRDASHLWGQLTHDVEMTLQAELDDKKIEVAQIGPAGEKLSTFAAIMNMSNRAWGRTGVGAVMGSKKLKAIVVRGSEKVKPADVKSIGKMAKAGAKGLNDNRSVKYLGMYGTANVTVGQHMGGGQATNNWDSGVLPSQEDAEALGGARLYDELLKGAAEGKQERQGRHTCYACVVRCKRVVESEWMSNPIKPEYGGPEYETISTFGSYCGITDLHAISFANQLCNQYGVDTISCGATLSWAIDAFVNGALTTADTGGLELRYGDAELMIKLLEMTLKREGFGDVLAEGSAKAADRLGKGHDYLLTVKGQELPAHMPHVKRSLGLIYAVNPFGADHQSSEHDPMYHPKLYEGKPERPGFKVYLNQIGLDKPQHPKAMNPEKVEFALKTQYNYSATDVLGLCQFVFGPGWQLYGPQQMADLMVAATGWDVTVEEIQLIGQRRLNLMRAYNAREGLSRDQDTLPKKLFKKALQGGRTDGMTLDPAEFEMSLDLYYEQAGWDVTTGNPTAETLESVGLGWVLG